MFEERGRQLDKYNKQIDRYYYHHQGGKADEEERIPSR